MVRDIYLVSNKVDKHGPEDLMFIGIDAGGRVEVYVTMA